MNNYITTTAVDLGGLGNQDMIASYSQDTMGSSYSNAVSNIQPRYCPSCEDRGRIRSNRIPMTVGAFRYRNSIGSFYNANPYDDTQLDTGSVEDLPVSSYTGSGSTSATSDCNWFKKLMGQCDGKTSASSKMDKCRARYPNDYDGYKKCMSQSGLSSILDSVSGLASIFGGGAAANANNSFSGIPPEDKSMGTGWWIAIGAGVVLITLAVLATKKSDAVSK